MMTNFIQEGGWGMYPVLVFGLAAFGVALWQVVAPKRDRVTLIGWLMGLTIVAGMLGTATGLQASAHHVAQVATDERWLFLMGLRESLNNLVTALSFVSLAMMLMVLSHLRSGPKHRKVQAPEGSGSASAEDGVLLRAV